MQEFLKKFWELKTLMTNNAFFGLMALNFVCLSKYKSFPYGGYACKNN